MRDAESLVDTLFEEGILTEDRTGEVRTTSDFEGTRAIYHDTYGHATDEDFLQAVMGTFGLSSEEASERIEAGDVTRRSLVTFLSLKSDIDQDVSAAELGAMAEVVTEVTPESPVPGDVLEVTDESAPSFFAEHPDSVVITFKHYCEPCKSLSAALDHLRAAVPDHVTWAGVDGESATAFCEEHDVEAAPTTLMFRDGELVDSKRGWAGPGPIVQALQDVYGE